jgi:hypothetical protein
VSRCPGVESTSSRRPSDVHSDSSPWLGTLGAQSGHSRGSRRYPDHPEVPVPLSAPGVNRTPDLQVRSLTLYPTELRAQERKQGFSRDARGAATSSVRPVCGMPCRPSIPGVVLMATQPSHAQEATTQDATTQQAPSDGIATPILSDGVTVGVGIEVIADPDDEEPLGVRVE